jgi:hypothetical protein
MGPRSGHFIFKKGTKWKDLLPAHEGMMKLFLQETAQVSDEEFFDRMLIRQDLVDLTKNRKPSGYNRNNKVRLIFPLRDDGIIEMYIYRSTRDEDIVRVTNLISDYLNEHGLEHEVKWDEMFLYELKERRKR